MEIGMIITARVNSKRVHKKVLQKINNQRTIDILFDHVIPNDNIYPVVLAIRKNKEDDVLEQIANERGIEVYRGEDDSPLHRIYECAKQNEFNNIIRITTDDILIDQFLLRKQIKRHLSMHNDYTYIGSHCVEGTSGEIIKFSAIEEVALKYKNSIEHISFYLKQGFKTHEFYPPFEYQHPYRCTIDYPEDLMLMRVLFASLRQNFGTLDIINFLSKHKYFLRINHLPKLTFFTCCYNQEKYIIDCVNSVIEQTYDDFEYIIIDDCSSDNSIKKIMEWYSKLENETQKKIKIIRNEKNIGLSGSSNIALEVARGKFVCRVDSDDVVNNFFAEIILKEFEIDNSICVVFTKYKTIDENGNELISIVNNPHHPGCCIMFRKCANELKFQENIKYLDGKEFFNRFLKRFKFKEIDDVLWSYRQHAEQKTKQPDHPNNI